MTLCQSRICPIVPAAPYQSFFLDRAIVYPCNDIYELALFVLEDYDALICLLEGGGNLCRTT